MITALSPLDGRYQGKLKPLSQYFSEAALIRHRIEVECLWVKHLHSALKLDLQPSTVKTLDALIASVSDEDVQSVKDIEAQTNHDVKAVEYFIAKTLKASGSKDSELAWVHFGCTSEDINNTSYGLMIHRYLKDALFAEIKDLHSKLNTLIESTKNLPMLSHTHGQTASPTTMGKEFAVFSFRLNEIFRRLKEVKPKGKFSGAVGNYNAHLVCFPEHNWQKITQDFLSSLGMEQLLLTTQIENHDWLAHLFGEVSHYNGVLLDLVRDVWTYISKGYLMQKRVEGEVGSSTMPHKVNPIDFENAEGNLGLANALLNHLSEKLPVSRLQRDLSDSTVLRNVGVAFGHGFLSLKSISKGLSKISPNHSKLESDLDGAWEVLAEPVQMILRTLGHSDAYEKLKLFSRGKKITQKDYIDFVKGLDLPADVASRLESLTPMNYLGCASKLVDQMNS